MGLLVVGFTHECEQLLPTIRGMTGNAALMTAHRLGQKRW